MGGGQPVITYRAGIGREITVCLERKIIGSIRRDNSGYFYITADNKHRGDSFPTIARCKESLEEDCGTNEAST